MLQEQLLVTNIRMPRMGVRDSERYRGIMLARCYPFNMRGQGIAFNMNPQVHSQSLSQEYTRVILISKKLYQGYARLMLFLQDVVFTVPPNPWSSLEVTVDTQPCPCIPLPSPHVAHPPIPCLRRRTGSRRRRSSLRRRQQLLPCDLMR